MWKTLLLVQDGSPGGQTTHTSTFKPLIGWAVGHIHFHSIVKARVSGAGQYTQRHSNEGAHMSAEQ